MNKKIERDKIRKAGIERERKKEVMEAKRKWKKENLKI